MCRLVSDRKKGGLLEASAPSSPNIQYPQILIFSINLQIELRAQESLGCRRYRRRHLRCLVSRRYHDRIDLLGSFRH